MDKENNDALSAALDPEWPGGFPYSILVAPGGRIIQRQMGEIDPIKLKKVITLYNHAGGSGGSLWYRWTPVRDGLVVATTKDEPGDTVLAVYTGNSLTNLQLVAADDDSGIILGTVRSSLVSFSAVAGTSYSIAVGTYASLTDSGSIVLALDVSYQIPFLTIANMKPLVLSVGGAPLKVGRIRASKDLLIWADLDLQAFDLQNAQTFELDSSQADHLFFRLAP